MNPNSIEKLKQAEKSSDKEDRPAREIPAQSHISLYHNPTT